MSENFFFNYASSASSPTTISEEDTTPASGKHNADSGKAHDADLAFKEDGSGGSGEFGPESILYVASKDDGGRVAVRLRPRNAEEMMVDVARTSVCLRALGPARIHRPLPRACSGSLASQRWASSLGQSSPVQQHVPRARSPAGAALRVVESMKLVSRVGPFFIFSLGFMVEF